MKLNRRIALDSTFHLFIVLGFVALFAFVFTAHWLLVCAMFPALTFAWWILYKFEEGLERRREEKEPHILKWQTLSGRTGEVAWKPGLK